MLYIYIINIFIYFGFRLVFGLVSFQFGYFEYRNIRHSKNFRSKISNCKNSQKSVKS